MATAEREITGWIGRVRYLQTRNGLQTARIVAAVRIARRTYVYTVDTPAGRIIGYDASDYRTLYTARELSLFQG